MIKVGDEVYKIEKVQDKLRVYYDCGDNTLAEISQMILGSDELSLPKSTIQKDPNSEKAYFIEREYSENKKYSLWRAAYRGPFKVGESIKIK